MEQQREICQVRKGRGKYMNASKVELSKCFLSSIDAAKKYVDYNEYQMDPDGEIYQYILQLFAYNYDNVAAKKARFGDESFLATVLPEKEEEFGAFVDVVTDEMHTLISEAVDLGAGSGLFLWATVAEQPVIAFFKLNYQTKFTCELTDGGEVIWKQSGRLLPSYTQKEYDYFFINLYEHKVWMSDSKCYIDGEMVNYMADRILQLELKKSEKEAVTVFENAVLDTIRECYEEHEETPKKIFEYRQAVVAEAEDMGEISPVRMEERLFADNEKAREVYHEKVEELKIADQPVEIGKKTERKLKKKQKIVLKSGIELQVPVECLEDHNLFEYKQDEIGNVLIRIQDTGGTIK